MCYSKETSLMSFIFGISVSYILIKFGNEKSDSTNKTIGYFFMFISFVQLIEYFIWSDLDCKTGTNKLTSLVGPLIINLQPVVLLLIMSIYLESSNIIPSSIVNLLNILYICYVGYKYNNYIQNESNLCVQENEKKHLDWTWKKDFNYNYYHLLALINLINYSSNTVLISTIGFSYIILYASYFNFKENIGELWCLISTSIPLFSLFIEKVLNVNN